MTEISRPFGRRVSGDEPGDSACGSRLGDVVTDISRADSASGKLAFSMLRHRSDVCNANGKTDAVAHMEERGFLSQAVLAMVTGGYCRNRCSRLIDLRARRIEDIDAPFLT